MEFNVANQPVTIYAYDYTTGAPKTGISANLRLHVGNVSTNFMTLAALGNSTVTEVNTNNAPGVYMALLSAAETNSREIQVAANCAVANVATVSQRITITPVNFANHTIAAGQTLSQISDVTNANTAILAAVAAANTAVAAVGSNVTAANVNVSAVGANVVAANTNVSAVATAVSAANTNVSGVGALVSAANVNVTAVMTRIGAAGANLTALGDTRIANLDATVSSRLATAGYTAPLDAAGTRTAVGLASANLDTQLAALPEDVVTFQMTESYAADGVAPTPAQALFLIQQSLHEFAISSTTRTVKKLDGSTTAATFTLDDASLPTSTTRAT